MLANSVTDAFNEGYRFCLTNSVEVKGLVDALEATLQVVEDAKVKEIIKVALDRYKKRIERLK